MRILLAASAACVLLSSCAGMSKSECLYADWRAIGYEDGARGAPVSALSPRRQACANKAGVTADMASYLEGREMGLGQFCTAANGFSVGAQGQSYAGVCAGHDEAAFLVEYRAGVHLHGLRDRAARASRALYNAEQDLEDIRHDIAHLEAALVAADTPVDARIEYLAQLKHLSEDRGRIEQSLVDLAIAVERTQTELDAFQWHLAVADQPDAPFETASR